MRATLEGVEVAEIGRVTRMLREALDAAGPGDLAGRPLYAGLRDLPWPTDPHAALWHVATLHREHRDLAQQPVLDALEDDLDELLGTLDRWADHVFPPDPFKRAAG